MAFGQRNKCSKGIKNKTADNNMQKTLQRFFAWGRYVQIKTGNMKLKFLIV